MSSNQQRREAAKRKLERQQARRAQRSQRRKRVSVITGVAVVVLLVAVVVVFSLTRGGSGGGKGTQTTTSASPAPNAAPPTDLHLPTKIEPPIVRPQPFPATVTCAYQPDRQPPAKPVQPPPTADISARGTVPVAMPTSAGEIDFTLDRALAPCTVNNFLSLAKQGYFDATSCHRLTTDPGLQVLQCGDPAGTGAGGPGYQFADETFPQLKYGRGYLAMANAGPNTNGSQFFMIYGDASALTPDYTVFGYLSPSALQVLDTVAKAGHDGSLDPNPGGGKPNTKVTITKVTAS